MKIVIYNSSYRSAWNEFVTNAKNAHFFFKREYMEYHSDRFRDFSLIVLDEKEKIVSLLPANIDEGIVYSHQGLTFGGFLVDGKMDTETMLEIFHLTKLFLKEHDVEKLVYKAIPYIYHTNPAEEDKYALFRNDAKLVRRDVSSTIRLGNRIRYKKGRKWSIKKAIKNALFFEESKDYDGYWSVLEETLQAQHSAKPVHSLSEIKKLAGMFPNNIKLFVAQRGGKVLGGALVFENKDIVHTQYLANSSEGRDLGALDFVIDKLINEVYSGTRYFDFGMSNEDAGRYLNTGLIAYKEGYGARAVVYDFYEMDIM